MSAAAAPAIAVADRTRSLGGRASDFWMLGGLSLVVWAVMITLHQIRLPAPGGPIDGYFSDVGAATLMLSLLFNYPHFVSSYALVWRRGPKFWLRHWLALIVVPVLTVQAIWAAWLAWRVPGFGAGAAELITRAYAAIGEPIAEGTPTARILRSAFLDVAFLTVGWHYSKQVYGCMMVYARFDEYPLTRAQRLWIRCALHTLWVLDWVAMNVRHEEVDAFGLQHASIGVPIWTWRLALTAFVLVTAAAVVAVPVAIWRRHRRRPSVNFLVPWIALVVWFAPFLWQPEFAFACVPLFHSLQYLAFVRRVERARIDETPSRWSPDIRFGALVIGLIVAGMIAFDFLPHALDVGLHARAIAGGAFFAGGLVAMAINVHHFFIDSVIWRLDDPTLRRRLFGPSI